MDFIVYVGFILVTLGYGVCDDQESYNGTIIQTANISLDLGFEAMANASDIMLNGSELVATVVEDIGHKLQDAIDEKLDVSNEENSTNEFLGVDAAGCNRGLRNELEEKCDHQYDKVNEETYQIEDGDQKTEALCCALEDFEKCTLRAYDKANCATDKAAIRENLKAAHLFISVIANVTCAQFRGQCAHYTATAAGQSVGYVSLIASVAVSLGMILA